MVDFLKWGGPLIVASLALAQPWLLALWRRLFRQGTIDTHETGNIEVGFSGYGATIGLNGTLRAVHQDQFVSNIRLSLVKLKDSSRHLLDWGVFRSQKVSTAGSQEQSIELPAGFMLTTPQPQRFSIQFFDIALQDDMKPQIEAVLGGWQAAVADADIAGLLELGLDATAITQRVDEVYRQFSENSVHVSAYTALDRLCYWEAGQYSLEMQVSTARPDARFTRKWQFELTDQDANNVRSNSLKIVQDACGRTYGQYLFAYAPYGEAW
ncbi:MAG: hypothetical protein WD379_03250 [Dehalococcoidia bacterium]